MLRLACLVSTVVAGSSIAAEPVEFTCFPDLTYATVGDDKMKLNLVVPAGPGPHPCRLAPENKFPAQIEDAKTAARFLRTSNIRAESALTSTPQSVRPNFIRPGRADVRHDGSFGA